MRILLDTNVVSELVDGEAHPAVEAWVTGHRLNDLFFSAIGEAELRFGAAILPTGRRRELLLSNIEAFLIRAFRGRVLSFNSRAAVAFAEISATLRSTGRPIPYGDAHIAAIARSRGMAVATRDVRHFAATDVEIVNPWEIE